MTEVVSATCLNCGTALAGAWCAACGQKARPLNPTFADFLHEFTHEMLHVDGKIFSVAYFAITSFAFVQRRSRPRLGPRRAGRGRHAAAARPLVVVYGVVYAVLAFRTAYGGSTGRTIVRTALVLSVYFLAVTFSSLAIALPAVFKAGGL